MIDFESSMSSSKNYSIRTSPEKWGILKELYNKNIQSNKQQKIPKIIHQIWLGSPIPPSLVQLMNSVKASNPSYIYHIWTDKEVETYNFKNKDLYNRAKNQGQKSDILRYAILKDFGGIYVDTDFIGVQSFDNLLHLDFFTGTSYDSKPTLLNGLIGSTANNLLIEDLNKILSISDKDGMDIIKSTGPWYLTDKFFDNYKKIDNIIALPLSYFYPFPSEPYDKIHGEDYNRYIKPETICIHLWHSRWN
jgi:mannosyltransferase OCH1-like enzyme